MPHEGIDDRTVYVYSIIKYICTGDDLDMDVEMVEYVADKHKLNCFMIFSFLFKMKTHKIKPKTIAILPIILYRM